MLPKDEQKELTILFPYDGWYNIEQLEDIIGEEAACGLHFGVVQDDDGEVDIKYDLEITFKRIRRTEK